MWTESQPQLEVLQPPQPQAAQPQAPMCQSQDWGSEEAGFGSCFQDLLFSPRDSRREGSRRDHHHHQSSPPVTSEHEKKKKKQKKKKKKKTKRRKKREKTQSWNMSSFNSSRL